ncbi:hypothetical protein GW17_00018485 [Ensete ventricosum]|nr:hypothetical protein GW17_00018485 [Ensete ventricosum]
MGDEGAGDAVGQRQGLAAMAGMTATKEGRKRAMQSKLRTSGQTWNSTRAVIGFLRKPGRKGGRGKEDDMSSGRGKRRGKEGEKGCKGPHAVHGRPRTYIILRHVEWVITFFLFIFLAAFTDGNTSIEDATDSSFLDHEISQSLTLEGLVAAKLIG